MSTPVIHRPSSGSKPRALWRRIAGIDQRSASIMFWNRITEPSNAGAREPTFSFILGSLAYDRPL
jgi:hypothetical protein